MRNSRGNFTFALILFWLGVAIGALLQYSLNLN